MNDQLNGFLYSLATTAIGGGFMTGLEMPKTPDGWFKLAIGVVILVATSYIAWRKQSDDRKTVWTDEQRTAATGDK